MKQFFERLLSIPFHPFLFAVYPVLHLLSQNYIYIHTTEFLRAALFIEILLIISWAIIYFVTRNIKVSALYSSVLLLSLFLYSPVYELTTDWQVLGINLHKHSITLISGVVLIVFVFYFIRHNKTHIEFLTKLSNLTSSILILLSLVSILFIQLQFMDENLTVAETKTDLALPNSFPADSLPDIYYLILDGYNRHDILEKKFHHNNLPFLDSLRNRGFYVADSSYSNYFKTIQTTASALNYKFLQNYQLKGIDSERDIINAVQDNKLLSLLKKSGYLSICFSSGYNLTTLKNVDFLLDKGLLSQVEKALLYKTFYRAISESASIERWQAKNFKAEYAPSLAQKMLFTFNELKHLRNKYIAKPIFVFSDILIAHEPFVFKQDGEIRKVSEDYALTYSTKDVGLRHKEYREQLIYGNKKILEAIDGILKNATRPTVIFLHGDHGSTIIPENGFKQQDFCNRYAILNAYYFSNGDYSKLYPSISPVNNIPVMFNTYFDMNIPLLPDSSFFPDPENQYRFINITDTLKHCTGQISYSE